MPIHLDGTVVQIVFIFFHTDKPFCATNQGAKIGAVPGLAIQVLCDVSSNPPVQTYSWWFNNSDDMSVIERATTSPSYRYVIHSNVSYGIISCMGTNVIGQQTTPCFFNIIPASMPQTPQKCQIKNSTQPLRKLKCIAGHDGGLLQKFNLEIYEGEPLKLLYNFTNPNTPSFSLPVFYHKDTIFLRLYAWNAKGRSGYVSKTLQKPPHTNYQGWLEVWFEDNQTMFVTVGILSLTVMLIFIAWIIYQHRTCLPTITHH